MGSTNKDIHEETHASTVRGGVRWREYGDDVPRTIDDIENARAVAIIRQRQAQKSGSTSLNEAMQYEAPKPKKVRKTFASTVILVIAVVVALLFTFAWLSGAQSRANQARGYVQTGVGPGILELNSQIIHDGTPMPDFETQPEFAFTVKLHLPAGMSPEGKRIVKCTTQGAPDKNGKRSVFEANAIFDQDGNLVPDKGWTLDPDGRTLVRTVSLKDDGRLIVENLPGDTSYEVAYDPAASARSKDFETAPIGGYAGENLGDSGVSLDFYHKYIRATLEVSKVVESAGDHAPTEADLEEAHTFYVHIDGMTSVEGEGATGTLTFGEGDGSFTVTPKLVDFVQGASADAQSTAGGSTSHAVPHAPKGSSSWYKFSLRHGQKLVFSGLPAYGSDNIAPVAFEVVEFVPADAAFDPDQAIADAYSDGDGCTFASIQGKLAVAAKADAAFTNAFGADSAADGGIVISKEVARASGDALSQQQRDEEFQFDIQIPLSVFNEDDIAEDESGARHVPLTWWLSGDVGQPDGASTHISDPTIASLQSAANGDVNDESVKQLQLTVAADGQSAEGRLTLKHNQSATMWGMPHGTKVNVSEALTISQANACVQPIPERSVEVHGGAKTQVSYLNIAKETGTIAGEMRWDDSNEANIPGLALLKSLFGSEKHDPVVVDLVQGPRATGTVVATTQTGEDALWAYRFDGMQLLDKSGVPIEYHVRERVPEGYVALYHDDTASDAYDAARPDDITNKPLGIVQVDPPVSVRLSGKNAADAAQGLTFELILQPMPASDQAIADVPMPKGVKDSKGALHGSVNGGYNNGVADVQEFGNIAYDSSHVGKTYRYEIREVVPDEANRAKGWTYDSAVYTMDVTILRGENGVLEASVALGDEEGGIYSKNDGIVISNSYAGSGSGGSSGQSAPGEPSNPDGSNNAANPDSPAGSDGNGGGSGSGEVASESPFDYFIRNMEALAQAKDPALYISFGLLGAAVVSVLLALLVFKWRKKH